MPQPGTEGDLPLDTDLVCVYCAKVLEGPYPCAILADGERSRTYHMCRECYRGVMSELESQYRMSLVSKEAGEREGMEDPL